MLLTCLWYICRKGTIKVRIQEEEDNSDDSRGQETMTTWVLRTTNIRRFRLINSISLQRRRGIIAKLVIDGVIFNLTGKRRDISEELLFSGTFLRDPQAPKGTPLWQVCTRSTRY